MDVGIIDEERVFDLNAAEAIGTFGISARIRLSAVGKEVFSMVGPPQRIGDGLCPTLHVH